MLPVGEDGSIIEKLVQKLERYLKDTSPHYYPPVENLLDLVYEHYTENNSIAPESTAAGRVAKQNEKKQGSVCCAWEKTAFEEGMKIGIRLMMEVMGES